MPFIFSSDPLGEVPILSRIYSAICLDTLQVEDMVRHLPCQHYFHSSCLDGWYMRQHYTCPLCKTPFYEDPSKKESTAIDSLGNAINQQRQQRGL